MKKKGFTLIELLTVIVILAIIALVATPIVLNLIRSAKKGSFARSVESVLQMSNMYYFFEVRDENQEDVTFTCDDSKCVTDGGASLDIDGSMGEGYVYISSTGEVELKLGKWGFCAIKYKNKKDIIVKEKSCEDVEIIYDEQAPTISLTVENGTTYETSKKGTITIEDNEELENKSVNIYYKWSTNDVTCEEMTDVVTLDPTEDKKIMSGDITITTLSDRYGAGKLYICNKEEIKDTSGNKIEANTIQSENMYISSPLSVSLTSTGTEYDSISVKATVKLSEGTKVTKYEFKRDSQSYSSNGTTSTKTFSSLSPQTSYTIYVKVTDSAGNEAETHKTITTKRRCSDEDCTWRTDSICVSRCNSSYDSCLSRVESDYDSCQEEARAILECKVGGGDCDGKNSKDALAVLKRCDQEQSDGNSSCSSSLSSCEDSCDYEDCDTYYYSC